MNDTPHSPSPPPAVPAGPLQAAMPPIQIQMPRQRGAFRRIMTGVIGAVLLASILVNIYLLSLLSATLGGPMDTTTIRKGDASETIAVYNVQGMITVTQAQQFDTFVRTVLEDGDVRAVVIRVDTPGGAVAPSDQMNRAVQRLKAGGKKVVVSMGGVAASGGYYLSASADRIFAEPTTITGSIGVISQVPIVVGTMERIGMRMHIMRSTAAEDHKVSLNPFEEPSAEALADHVALLNRIQDLFIEAVVAGRASLDADEVAQIADGRVWIGREALDKELVDEIGYLADATESAAAMAGLSDPRVLRYRMRSTLRQALLGVTSPAVRIDADFLDEIQTPRVMMIWRP